MADIKLVQGATTTLTMGADTVANGAAVSSNALSLVADDISPIEDAVRIDVSFADGTLGEPVSVYVAQGNTAGEFDGNCPEGSTAVPADALPNLGVPIPIISQATNPSRGHGIFAMKKSRLIVVVENHCTDAIASLVVKATPLHYQSN